MYAHTHTILASSSMHKYELVVVLINMCVYIMYFDTIGAKIISNNTRSGMHTLVVLLCWQFANIQYGWYTLVIKILPGPALFVRSYPRAPTTFDMLFLHCYCGHRGALNGVRAAGPARANCRTLSSVVSWQIVIQRAQVISCSPRRHRRDQTFKKTSHIPSQ